MTSYRDGEMNENLRPVLPTNLLGNLFEIKTCHA